MSKKTVDTRQALLDAACKLFSEFGYNAVSTRMIADEANVNLGGIHYHFTNKESLYIEVFRKAMNADKALTIDKLLATDPKLLQTPEGKSYAILRIVFDYFDRNFIIAEEWKRKLVFREVFDHSPVHLRLVDEVLKYESEKMYEFYRMLVPNASESEVRIWSHMPDTQAVYYMVSESMLKKYFEKEFVEELCLNVMKTTTKMMILMLDLPVPAILLKAT